MSCITLIKSALDHSGGLEKYAWRLAHDFCALGLSVTLLTTGTISPPFSHPLLTLVSFPIQHRLSVLKLLAFDKACTAYLHAHPTPIVFDLDRTRFSTHIRAGNGVHAHYLEARAQEEGMAKAWSFRLNPLHRTLLSLEKRSFEQPHLQKLFTNSHMVRTQILARFAIPAEKITVLHNGVEWHELQDPFDQWEKVKVCYCEKGGLDPTVYQFLFSGHHYKRKGLDKLLSALAHLKEEPFQLSVVGKDRDLPLYRKMAVSLGLEKKVFFFGSVSSMTPFYQYADALVIPSLYDPFANVTVEALAMGLFVISSQTNGGCEVLTEDTGRILDDLHDPTLFASTLRTALSHPKTRENALMIRQSIKHLDFSQQLRQMTMHVLESRV